ncbi:aminotransferase class IV [Psychroserpens sp.]|uniref:aminotransferase class IV n=1 Tax=Psychroserpens sp. TaxID=2020870 RepID=UPI001B2CF4EC|nr:aminotransferase class IV [Psychroserpens sp.]MBO6607252.1 aminotransferase class IV [Psychroserpens sp.]MBO6631480.1 aminotransferase class IV [Psychroserpens sp.]MBO6654398.1 aminotransferase class IV [Psychroserpens sp.]MBO6682316.1 aminotransferase class IV [Psychroserpens sp.]MBO6751024.1 aminotransferase class IV [Psychroserpens sp.]
MVHGTHNAVEDDRNKDVLIYINGEYFKRDEAKISVFDSGYLVGDGIWEALRLHDDVLVFLEDHLERLWTAAATIGLKFPFTKAELTGTIWEVIQKNDMHDNVHVRIMITRGIKKTPSQDPRLTLYGPNIVIIPEYKKASEESKQKGITLFTSTIRRGSPDYLDPRLNCHSKLHEVQALIQAIEAGADEALMLDINGFVSTCNATNFFMIKNGEVWTSTGEYCMNGITRAKVIQVCDRLNIPCYEKNFSLFDVYGADEAFVTGTFGGLTPVFKIDGRRIGDATFGGLTQQLSKGYKALISETVSNA